MITQMFLVLMSLSVNGTDTSECDYSDDDGSAQPYQQDLVDCSDNYYCKNYYGENESSARDLLLRPGCDSDSDCDNYYGGPKTGLYDLLDRDCY